MTNSRCPIWPDFAADVQLDERKALWWVDSPRAGGRYGITEPAANLLEQGWGSSELGKARLTTRVIDHRQETGRPLLITCEMLETDAQDLLAASLSVPDRVQRLMKQLARCSTTIGQEITLFCHLSDPKAFPQMSEIGQRALAWSESTTADELKFLCRYLVAKGWIRLARRHAADPDFGVEVTVQGFAAIDSPPDSESNEAFVAMWLDESMDEVFDRGIKPGIEEAEYKVVRIDRDKNVDKIDDAVMAAIRRCRFVLADFTHGEGGVRGSVYFEAGFARGLGIEVVSTCRKDCIEKLHFDTRQYHHIAWESDKLDDLRREVTDRIGARVGPPSPPRRRQPTS